MKQLTLLFLLSILCFAAQSQDKQYPPSNPSSVEWFADLRFGMFIHWDMSSVAGTEISWSRKATKPLDITGDPAGYVEDPIYDNLYKKFNPVQFDAVEWVNIAKAAGMKYIVFTAKHHGGFSMWDTRLSDYSIMQSPYGKDVIKQLAEACHAAGMKFGLYYSQRDWHHPAYGVGDNKEYINYMNGQIKELLTNYGQIDILWWDSYGVGDLENFWQIENTYNLVKKLQPNIIMNNRLAILAKYNKQPVEFRGDWDTPEQTIGKFQNHRLWESCLTLTTVADIGGWSYRPDGQLRSFKECIRALVGCATGDGNLLLGIGPDAKGLIPADQKNRIVEIGDWLEKYGESIYATRGGPFKKADWGASTYKGNKIYLHINKWKDNKITLPSLKGKVINFYNLTNKRHAPTLIQNDKNFIITLAADKQDSIDTIIVLELDHVISEKWNGRAPLELIEATL